MCPQFVHTLGLQNSSLLLSPVVVAVMFSGFCLATEYHEMMLYYMLPLVRHYLPVDHFQHFAVLVTAISILLSQPTCAEVDKAAVLLQYFVKEMESLYGQIFASAFVICYYFNSFVTSL